MKYYKNENNEVYGYPADGSGDAYIKPDLIQITDAEADELRQPPPPTLDEVRTALSNAVQNLLDTTARERNYDGIVSACSYIASANPKFAAEASACVAWRDAVWAECYELLDKVMYGEIDIPTEDELIAMLPQMEWPETLKLEQSHVDDAQT